eukprot:COSAG01_NODE_5104_length_4479_cov_3.354338_1_plen_120_part_00
MLSSPRADTSVGMMVRNPAIRAWYVRGEAGLDNRKTSATSSDSLGYSRPYVTPAAAAAVAPARAEVGKLPRSDSQNSLVFESPVRGPTAAASAKGGPVAMTLGATRSSTSSTIIGLPAR